MPRVVVRVLLWLQVLVAGMRVLGTSGHAAPLTATPGTLDNSFLVNLLNMGPALGPVLRAAPALRMHGVVLGPRHHHWSISIAMIYIPEGAVYA